MLVVGMLVSMDAPFKNMHTNTCVCPGCNFRMDAQATLWDC